MAIEYDFLVRPGQNLTEGEQPLLYPKAVSRGTVSFKQMAEDIQQATGLTVSDVVAVMSAMTQMSVEYLNRGMHVELADFGTLSVGIAVDKDADGHMPDITSPRQVKPHHLHVSKVLFNAKPEFMIQLQGPFVRAKTSFNIQHATTGSSIDERRTLLINEMQRSNAITASRYMQLTGLTRMKANAELNTFVDEGILQRHGIKTHIFFTLAPHTESEGGE